MTDIRPLQETDAEAVLAITMVAAVPICVHTAPSLETKPAKELPCRVKRNQYGNGTAGPLVVANAPPELALVCHSTCAVPPGTVFFKRR